MKIRIILLLAFSFTSFISYGQNLEVQGKVKVTEMDTTSIADSVVVWLPDGTLATRDANTIQEYQVLSISNDTVYLTNGGFIVVPVDSLSQVLNKGNNAGGNQIKNLADPTDAQDAVTKNYLGQMNQFDLDKFLNSGLNGYVDDIDSNYYKTIKIGNQVWMAENLKTTRYSDGTIISQINDKTDWSNTSTDSTPAWVWYDTTSTYDNLFGKLYNWYVVDSLSNGGRNVCPEGWKVPSVSDWNILTDFLTNNYYGHEGSGNDIASSMASKSLWTSNAVSGTVGNDTGRNNLSGFSAVPSGRRAQDGDFEQILNHTEFWSSEENSSSLAFWRGFGYLMSTVNSAAAFKPSGFPIRCLRIDN